MFPHAFVQARLLPHLSMAGTSYYGSNVVADLFHTRPFAALRVHWLPDMGFYEASPPYGGKGLFMISQEKPRPPFRDFYIPLTAGDERPPLQLNVPLPIQGPLYLHMFPAIPERFEMRASGPMDQSFHQLDFASIERFISFFRHARPPRVMSPPRSGGSEVVQSGWSSFSGPPQAEVSRPPRGYIFEITPISTDTFTQTDTVWNELLLCDQLIKDYSWSGVTKTVTWLKRLRNTHVETRVLQFPVGNYDGIVPILPDEHSSVLFRMTIVMDEESEPPKTITEPSSNEDDEDDDPSPLNSFVPVHAAETIIPKSPPKMIVLDMCSIFFVSYPPLATRIIISLTCPQDHHAAVIAALAEFRLDTPQRNKAIRRLRELEALEYAAGGGTYQDVVRRALRIFATEMKRPHLKVEALAMAVLRPPIRSAVRESVQQLLHSGFHVIGYSAMDATTFQAYLEPAIHDLRLPVVSPLPSDARGLFAPCVEQLRSVLDYASARPSPLSPDQILVVSSSSVRSLEPATAVGMATALLAEADELEVQALKRTYTARSTMVTSLTDLATTVSDPALWRRSVPDRGVAVPNLRVAGIYQLFRIYKDSDIGESSLSSSSQPPSVLNAINSLYLLLHRNPVVTTRCINWLTNEDVVVKASMSYETVKSTVPYEAVVYKQLASCPNVVPVRWSGKMGNADVLVMDWLGPNLDDLRRACRGKLSLRSVLMAGISIVRPSSI